MFQFLLPIIFSQNRIVETWAGGNKKTQKKLQTLNAGVEVVLKPKEQKKNQETFHG